MELVAAKLRVMIVSGELTPGKRLRQIDVARRFGVSTTPVREAFAALAREGLVEVDAYRGAVVFSPSLTDIRENYEMRIALDAWAPSSPRPRSARATVPRSPACSMRWRARRRPGALQRAQLAF